jgi:hypothetical protein
VDEVLTAELALPVAIARDVVDVDRSVLAAMRGEVGLRVACDVQPADPSAVGDLGLPDRRQNLATAPLNLPRQADVH